MMPKPSPLTPLSGLIGLRFVAAVATVFLGLGFGGVALAAETKSPIEGVWQGRYICEQGPTGVTLTIRTLPAWPGLQVYIHHWLMSLIRVPNLERPAGKPKRSEIAALFQFYPLPGAKAEPSGSFELNGTFDPALGLVDLYPSKWVEQPPGYSLIGFRAVVEDGTRLKGAINESGCGIIVLGRGTGELTAAPSSQNAPAQPEIEPDLLKLDQQVLQLLQAGDYEQSAKIAEQALAIAEQRYNADQPTVALQLTLLAQALTAAGRNEEAERAIRRALAIDEKAIGPEAPPTAFAFKIFLSVLVNMSWKDEAPKAVRNQVALTGQLPSILEQAVPLAFVASLLLLFIYRLAVKRSMRRRGGKTELPPGDPGDVKEPRAAPSMPLDIVTVEDTPAKSHLPSKFEAHALAGPWRNAAIYTVAGLCYVLILTAANLYAGDLELLPMRFVFFAAAFAWPIVLTVGLVAPVSWRGWLAIIGVYFLIFAAISVICLMRSEAFTWDQAVRLWLLTNVPGTFLILAFLPRPIRAVGPLVLVFMVAAVAGTTLWHNVLEFAGGPRVFLHVINFFNALGLESRQAVDATTYAIEILGALGLGLIGWLFLRGVGRLYRWHVITDQSVIIDSLWFLFALTSAIDFTFFGLSWFLAPFGAFAVYKIVAMTGFALAGERSSDADPKLLLLRVFALGKRSARLFNAFGKRWRHAGSIRLIAGPDLATSTVEPHEFLDFLSGKLGRRFIAGPETLDERLVETKRRRDFDGRYRVDDFFCHDDAWQMVLKRLARESDAVLMDLRGFLPGNLGCVFEINELLNVVPLDRVVFVVDDTTDLASLYGILREGWEAATTDSPNRSLAEPRALLFRFTGDRSVPALLRVVAEAVSGERHADRCRPEPAMLRWLQRLDVSQSGETDRG
jgi:tetratricopeptide (TPR) repeat protein